MKEGDYLDGDGIALGEEPPPGLPPGIGDATVGLLVVAGAPDRVPNQFHCVKPKNMRISTSRATHEPPLSSFTRLIR